jgi:hypothetical protein
LCGPGESYTRATTIDILSDDVLLEIFDSYRKIPFYHLFRVQVVWSWRSLAHVCRRWRQIILESPHRLNLQIFCTEKTPAGKNLRIWPTLPIVIKYNYMGRSLRPAGIGNVFAALRQPNRVCHVELNVTSSMLEKMVPLLQEPFPELTHIDIFSESTDGGMGVLPSGFLGGSASRLQELYFHNLSFPSLPTFLLSTSNLISLAFLRIPPTDYIAPEAMITCLAALPKLEQFVFGFQSATPRPDQIRPPPVTRIVLPALTAFTFNGASEYLENFVAHIDSPQLENIRVVCWNPLIDTPVAQLPEFVDRTIRSKLAVFRHAEVRYSRGFFSFVMYYPEIHPFWDWFPAQDPNMTIRRTVFSCGGIGRRVLDVARVLSRFSSATLCNVAHLELDLEPEESRQLRGATKTEWLCLLRQFPAAETLHVSSEISVYVALALEYIAEDITMVTGVLPYVDLICLEAQPVPSSVGKFVAMRRLAGRPVTVVNTTSEFDEILKSSYISE